MKILGRKTKYFLNPNAKYYIRFLFKIIIFIFYVTDIAVSQNIDDGNFLTLEEQKWIVENPLQKAIIGKNWRPFNFIQNGEASGLSVDYLNLVAQKVGLTIEYVNEGSWEKMLEQIREGNATIAHSISITEERKKFLNFTPSYLSLPMVYMGRIGSKRINNIDDLIGKKVGVVAGNNSTKLYKMKQPTLNYIDFVDIREALTALSIGSVDVVINTLSIMNYTITKNFITGLAVIGDDFLLEDDESERLRLAASKEQPLLISILKKGMLAVTDREFIDLSNKWMFETRVEYDIGLTEEERSWLSKNKTIKVAASLIRRPYEFVDNAGNISGVSGDYLKEISKRLNVEFIWSENEDWSDGLLKIKSGEADIVAALSSMREREQYLTFLEPYLSLLYVMFMQDGHSNVTILDNLSGQILAQVKNTVILNHIKRDFPGIEIIEVDTIVDALKLVSIGMADAYVGNIPTTATFISELGLSNVHVAGTTPYDLAAGMAVRSDLPLLASAMQKALRDIKPKTKDDIIKEWLTVKVDNKTDYDLIWKISAVVLFVFLFILYWLNRLQQEVKRRELIEKKLLISQKEARIAQLEAEAANEAKSSFLANMSHEIRTPLNAIMGFSEVMSSGLFGEIKQKKYREYLKDIRGSGEHLSVVIKNILDLSKIEAGKWQLEEAECDLGECVRDAFKMIECLAIEKNIKLLYDKNLSIFIRADCHALKRSLINLLSNAVKFTEEQDEVSCRVSKNIDGVMIEVSDTGVGIPKDQLEHVLKPFGQDQAHHISNNAGTGLGLSIVKQLIELHGGTFTLKSKEGVGTNAIILIPITRFLS